MGRRWRVQRGNTFLIKVLPYSVMRILFSVVLAAISVAWGQAASTLRLTVVDIHEFVVPGARVEARPLGGGTPISGLTGMDGTVELALDGPMEVFVRADGFEPMSRRLETPESPPLVLRLQPAVLRTTVNVTVRDDAAPLATVESALEIDRTAARTVLDGVDRVVPGAFLTRRGVMGYGIATNGTGGLSIRGVGGSPNTDILVVVDGHPDFQGLMGHPLPDFYSLSDAGTVTIIEGPASVLYGSNAMGGVVEIKPWVPTEGMSTRLTTSLGSFYTGQHRLSHGAAFRRGYYSLNAGVSHTSGDRPGSAFRDQDGTVTAGYDLSRSLAWVYRGAVRALPCRGSGTDQRSSLKQLRRRGPWWIQREPRQHNGARVGLHPRIFELRAALHHGRIPLYGSDYGNTRR
jgi:outer membrane receptor protein involved in Fe transport